MVLKKIPGFNITKTISKILERDINVNNDLLKDLNASGMYV